jgi:hypothetical protein
MVFLPGTSYAVRLDSIEYVVHYLLFFKALLAMPFFSSNEYLTTPTRIWVWIVLTIPSTALAFFIYRKVMRRAQQKYNLGDEEMQEPSSGNDEQQALAVKDREVSE